MGAETSRGYTILKSLNLDPALLETFDEDACRDIFWTYDLDESGDLNYQEFKTFVEGYAQAHNLPPQHLPKYCQYLWKELSNGRDGIQFSDLCSEYVEEEEPVSHSTHVIHSWENEAVTELPIAKDTKLTKSVADAKYPIEFLHPTQFTVGMAAVRNKVDRLNKLYHQGTLDKYLKKKARVPVIRGPNNILYLIDRHHTCTALWYSNADSLVYISIVTDLSHHSLEQFWAIMEEKKWCYLKKNGVGPLSWFDLPSSILGLSDDPYRSLARAVREAGGFVKTRVPFAEFQWADYLRPLIPLHQVEAENVWNCVREACALCNRPEAKDLDGYSPNPNLVRISSLDRKQQEEGIQHDGDASSSSSSSISSSSSSGPSGKDFSDAGKQRRKRRRRRKPRVNRSLHTTISDWPEITQDIADKVLRKVRIEDLRPTQFTIGMAIMRNKIDEINQRLQDEEKGQELLERYIIKRCVPVVLGPGDKLYLIDRHHTTTALYYSNAPKNVFVKVMGDYSRKSEEEFWQLLNRKKWCFLFKRGSGPLHPDQLPTSVLGLVDDPYRSLARGVREAKGFDKCKVPFAEFHWANYFRNCHDPRVNLHAVEAENVWSAVPAACSLSRRHQAKDLPGFIGEPWDESSLEAMHLKFTERKNKPKTTVDPSQNTDNSNKNNNDNPDNLTAATTTTTISTWTKWGLAVGTVLAGVATYLYLNRTNDTNTSTRSNNQNANQR